MIGRLFAGRLQLHNRFPTTPRLGHHSGAIRSVFLQH